MSPSRRSPKRGGSMDRYTMLSQAGDSASNRGDWRECCDQYLKATQSAPSKWSQNRYRIFHDYTSTLTDPLNDLIASPDDVSALKKIGKDENEPVLFRSEALATVGLIKVRLGERERAAEYYRQALEVIPEAAASEKNRRVQAPGSGGRSTQQRKVDDILNEKENMIEQDLDRLENPLGDAGSGVRSTGVSSDALLKRLGVGGGQCDCCGKTRTQVGQALLQCTRCKSAYYCSEACQKTQWKKGHKKYCRKPDEIKAGDHMKINGLISRPEYNNMVGKVKKRCNNGRYEISIEGLPNTISVAPEKLLHIRPAK